ncbi:hypothetical protein CEXT_660621 [Caerostris extrusa]|uniref:Uncharacterized protein n=1 Tax=Caerostris extrusa TaxID=172846 RepID=A0AAV4X2L4_CAEEX|nr:hypothetical protein CEXT_660621 [Caerostris extrusa]
MGPQIVIAAKIVNRDNAFRFSHAKSKVPLIFLIASSTGHTVGPEGGVLCNSFLYQRRSHIPCLNTSEELQVINILPSLI